MEKINYKKLREIDLNIIMKYVFNAIEVGTKDYYNTRQYLTKTDNKIAVTGLKWIDNTTNIGGIGALDLVIYLNNMALSEASDLLNNISDIKQFNTDIIISNYKTEVPKPCESTWNYVKFYLTKTRQIPEFIINNLYKKGLIWSDKRKNCVFPRDLNSGAYIRGIQPTKKFKMSLGINGRPFVIPGNDIIIITEAPIDAISLKFYNPKAKILATGGRLGFDKIKSYIINSNKVLLAQDNDKSGDEQARILDNKINIKTERLRPLYNLKDWNEVLQHDLYDLNDTTKLIYKYAFNNIIT